jgi:hypothetical protein
MPVLTFSIEKCRADVRKAETIDLFDCVTAYREGMDPQAIEVIEGELRRRGVTRAEIDERVEACRRECLFDAAGVALRCSRCRRPAVAEVWGWHRVWRWVPLFPRRLRLCAEHDPNRSRDCQGAVDRAP